MTLTVETDDQQRYRQNPRSPPHTWVDRGFGARETDVVTLVRNLEASRHAIEGPFCPLFTAVNNGQNGH